MVIFETEGIKGYRPLQFRFLENGKVQQRVVGKGKMHGWGSCGTLYPGESPQDWLNRNDWSGRFLDDSGAVTLPYALLGIAGYMVYFMISHGIIQALTALQAGR